MNIDMNILEGLNDAQKEAVLHLDGPCLVLAGAGSGKTRVLTKRVAYLVGRGVRPGNILAITFTNKAAREMRERVNQFVPGFSGQWVQTFHAACYRILRQEIERLGYHREFTIVDEGEQKALIKECLHDIQEYQTKPEVVGFYFKQIKNSLRSPAAYFRGSQVPAAAVELYLKVFRLYQARLKEMNALDFEDLIGLTIKLFRENEDVLIAYQDRFQYIMIDEYQDTNYSQYVWANLLAARHHNLFIVGDPDQSIYSWRGAEPENIKRFLRDYPEARVIKLETNYRSTRFILAAANAVISNNLDREEKTLVTSNPAGERLVRFRAADSYQEAEFIASTINHLVREQGYRYRDMAVFYRTHAQSRYLEDVFRHGFIPYYVVGARGFYQRKEVRDILAYLKLAANPADIISFRRVINLPRRGVGEATLKKIEEYAATHNLPVLEALAGPGRIPGISRKLAGVLEDFYGFIKYLQNLGENAPMTELIDQTLELSGYVQDLLKRDPLDAEERMGNLKELRSVALEFERSRPGNLGDFLSEVALTQEADDTDYSDAVALMTFHSAKGLEFPVVFMTGMEEGIFPSHRTETEAGMEEERRLCYVGITRACERLYLTSAVNRLLYGYEMRNLPSRFLNEIPDELFAPPREVTPGSGRAVSADNLDRSEPLALEMGDVVQHRKFGRGVVVEVTADDIAVIDFDQAGTKVLKTDIAPLTRVRPL